MATHKVKTHKGAKKRFKISATGKLIFQKQGMRHQICAVLCLTHKIFNILSIY